MNTQTIEEANADLDAISHLEMYGPIEEPEPLPSPDDMDYMELPLCGRMDWVQDKRWYQDYKATICERLASIPDLLMPRGWIITILGDDDEGGWGYDTKDVLAERIRWYLEMIEGQWDPRRITLTLTVTHYGPNLVATYGDRTLMDIISR